MLYAILCYNDEDMVFSWTQEQEAKVMDDLGKVQDKLIAQDRLGPVARLLPTTAATTLRKGGEAMVIDGPFAETKEQLLGFYIIECETLEQAIEDAKELLHANAGVGGYEIRPLLVFRPGGKVA